MANTFTELEAELKVKINEYVTSGSWNIQTVTGLDGVTRSYSTPQEMIDFYNSIKSLAQGEEATDVKSVYRPIAMRRRSFKR